MCAVGTWPGDLEKAGGLEFGEHRPKGFASEPKLSMDLPMGDLRESRDLVTSGLAVVRERGLVPDEEPDRHAGRAGYFPGAMHPGEANHGREERRVLGVWVLHLEKS